MIAHLERVIREQHAIYKHEHAVNTSTWPWAGHQ